MSQPMTWSQRLDWRWVDRIFALVLALDLAGEAAFASGVPDSYRLVSVVAALPYAMPIAVRRSWPRAALLSGMAVALIQQLVHGQLVTTLPSQSAVFMPILCAYGVGAWTGRREGALTIVAASVLLYGMGAVATAQHAPGAPGWAGSVGLSFFFLVPAWVVGCVARERGRRAEAFVALERQAITERDERERAAVAEERAAIGRELQDIIAHSVSVMVVQAGGARRLMGEQPERARESILAVEHTGRETLAEMRRLLGVLRRNDDPRALAPQPGLSQLGDLFEHLFDNGLSCRLEGALPVALTPGIDLVAYRVIEAALTGVADHGGSEACVAVRADPRALELEIIGLETGGLLTEDLRSVAERVALYDGSLDVSSRQGCVVVVCQLPLGAAVAV